MADYLNAAYDELHNIPRAQANEARSYDGRQRYVYLDCTENGYPNFDEEGTVYGVMSATCVPDTCNVRVYVPEAQANEVRRVTCGECEHFDNQIPSAAGRQSVCWKPEGLKAPKRDGSSSCSYAERKARGDG